MPIFFLTVSAWLLSFAIGVSICSSSIYYYVHRLLFLPCSVGGNVLCCFPGVLLCFPFFASILYLTTYNFSNVFLWIWMFLPHPGAALKNVAHIRFPLLNSFLSLASVAIFRSALAKTMCIFSSAHLDWPRWRYSASVQCFCNILGYVTFTNKAISNVSRKQQPVAQSTICKTVSASSNIYVCSFGCTISKEKCVMVCCI